MDDIEDTGMLNKDENNTKNILKLDLWLNSISSKIPTVNTCLRKFPEEEEGGAKRRVGRRVGGSERLGRAAGNDGCKERKVREEGDMMDDMVASDHGRWFGLDDV